MSPEINTYINSPGKRLWGRMLVLFFPTSVVLGSGLQLKMPEAGMIPKEAIVTIPLNLYVRISKCLKVQALALVALPTQMGVD